MKKKLVTLALSLILAVSVGASTIFASAAVKENTVADAILTSSGILNELDWTLKGDTADESYLKSGLGDIFEASNVAWAAGWLQPWDTFAFGDGYITMSFDVLDFDCDGSLRPLVGSTINTSVGGSWWFNNPKNGIMDGSTAGNSTITWHRTEELTVDDVTTAWGQVGWYVPWGTGYNRHVEFIYKVNGVLGIKGYNINKDGSYTFADQMWIENAFPGLDTTTKYYFGINYWNGPAIKFDNFKITRTTGETVETLVDCDFSGAWEETQGVPTEGKIYNRGGRTSTITEFLANNPVNTDRLVTELEIKADANVAKAATLKGTIDFRNLGKKFGFMTGLDNQEDALYTEGTSYVYFTQEENVTYLNVNNGGATEQKISLESDYVSGDFYDFTLVAYNNGTATLTIGEKTVDFELTNIKGYLAIVTDGEGTVEVALGGETALYGYVYRASKGEAIANNFNTGYVNPANWALNSTSAVMFADPTQARGIVAEDGKLKFAGSADGSFFGTTEDYADYVLEFVYETYNDADQPAQKEEWPHGYSSLGLCFGVQDGSGWASSIMVFIHPTYIQLQEFKYEYGRVEASNFADDYSVEPANAGETKRTAFKVVVANNVISVYYQELVEGTTPTTEAFILGASFKVVDTYGKVNFATTESGVFALDDIRVTPIDDPDAEKVAENVANHVDFAEIADEYRPITLDAPVVTMEENVISWAEVEGATGYVVNVNGTESEVITDLSYTIDISNPGDYVVTVYAVGNGSYISDSEQSEAIEFTVEAPVESNNNAGGGCGGSIDPISAVALLSLVAGAFIAKKREN